MISRDYGLVFWKPTGEKIRRNSMKRKELRTKNEEREENDKKQKTKKRRRKGKIKEKKECEEQEHEKRGKTEKSNGQKKKSIICSSTVPVYRRLHKISHCCKIPHPSRKKHNTTPLCYFFQSRNKRKFITRRHDIPHTLT